MNIKPHNDPEGMIALCAQHHKKADGGAYTVEQLHNLKKDKFNATVVKGNLDWLRRDLLAVVGGNFYFETPKIITVDGVDLVSLLRDEDGYLRLSVNMLSCLAEERIIIKDNYWENVGFPVDLRSPPQGKELEARYHNGDYLYLRFIELESFEKAQKRYSTNIFEDLSFPVTAVEVSMTIAGTSIELTNKSSFLGGLQVAGCLLSNCDGGIVIENTGISWKQNPKFRHEMLVEKTDHENVIKVNFSRR